MVYPDGQNWQLLSDFLRKANTHFTFVNVKLGHLRIS